MIEEIDCGGEAGGEPRRLLFLDDPRATGPVTLFGLMSSEQGSFDGLAPGVPHALMLRPGTTSKEERRDSVAAMVETSLGYFIGARRLPLTPRLVDTCPHRFTRFSSLPFASTANHVLVHST